MQVNPLPIPPCFPVFLQILPPPIPITSHRLPGAGGRRAQGLRPPRFGWRSQGLRPKAHGKVQWKVEVRRNMVFHGFGCHQRSVFQQDPPTSNTILPYDTHARPDPFSVLDLSVFWFCTDPHDPPAQDPMRRLAKRTNRNVLTIVGVLLLSLAGNPKILFFVLLGDTWSTRKDLTNPRIQKSYKLHNSLGSLGSNTC